MDRVASSKLVNTVATYREREDGIFYIVVLTEQVKKLRGGRDTRRKEKQQRENKHHISLVRLYTMRIARSSLCYKDWKSWRLPSLSLCRPDTMHAMLDKLASFSRRESARFLGRTTVSRPSLYDCHHKIVINFLSSDINM